MSTHANLVKRLVPSALVAALVAAASLAMAQPAVADTCPTGFSYSGAYYTRVAQTSLFTDMKYHNNPVSLSYGDHRLGYWTIGSYDSAGTIYGWYQLGVEIGYTPQFTDSNGVYHDTVYWSTPHVYSEWMSDASHFTPTRVGGYDFHDEGAAAYDTIYTLKLVQSSPGVWYGTVNNVNAHTGAHSIASGSPYALQFQSSGEDYSNDTNCDRHDVDMLTMGVSFNQFPTDPMPLSSPWDWCFSTYRTSMEVWDGNFSPPVGDANCNPPPMAPASGPQDLQGPLVTGVPMPPWMANIGPQS